MQHEPLILVPGLMCDHAVWEPLLPALAKGRECVVVDHGHASSLAVMAQQLLDAAPARFALAGHSMGARVALEVVRLAPQRVGRVALLDSGYLPRAPGAAGEEEARKRHALLQVAREQGVRAMAQVWVQGMVHPDRLGDVELVERILAMFTRKSADVFAAQIAALLARPDASDVLRSLRVPTLVCCGAQDSWSPPSQHADMHRLVPASTGAVLDTVSDAGHMAPMERPEAMAAALLRWLETVESA